jgi:hypothetical protein
VLKIQVICDMRCCAVLFVIVMDVYNALQFFKTSLTICGRISSSCENAKSRISYVHRCLSCVQQCHTVTAHLPRMRDHLYVARQEALRFASVLFLSVLGLRRLHGIMKSKSCCPVLVRTGQNPLQILRVKMS